MLTATHWRLMASVLLALGGGCSAILGLEDPILAQDGLIDASRDGPIGPDGGGGPIDARPIDAAPINLWTFVTNASFAGNFGAASGARVTADARCQDLYNLSFTGRDCTNIRAVIQVDDTLDTLGRMSLNYGVPETSAVFRATDGTRVSASWNDFVNPNAALIDPVSTSATSVFFWSGRAPTGNLQCTNWTSTSGSGNAGDAIRTAGWMARANITCDQLVQLLCVCW